LKKKDAGMCNLTNKSYNGYLTICGERKGRKTLKVNSICKSNNQEIPQTASIQTHFPGQTISTAYLLP